MITVATNAEIGERIGLSYSGVSRIRAGNRIPNRETMQRIEDATGWTLEQQSRAAAEGKYPAEFERLVMAHDYAAAS